MNTAAVQSRSPVLQDLRYQLPRWMLVFVVVTLIPQVMMFPPAGRSFWYLPSLVLIGLLEGGVGSVLFVGLQRWWNPKDDRVARIRNYLAATVIVAVGSLLAMTEVHN